MYVCVVCYDYAIIIHLFICLFHYFISFVWVCYVSCVFCSRHRSFRRCSLIEIMMFNVRYFSLFCCCFHFSFSLSLSLILALIPAISFSSLSALASLPFTRSQILSCHTMNSFDIWSGWIDQSNAKIAKERKKNTMLFARCNNDKNTLFDMKHRVAVIKCFIVIQRIFRIVASYAII